MELADETIDLDELFREIERYLDIVGEFRAAGCDVGGWLGRDGGGDGRARDAGGSPRARPMLPSRGPGEPPVSAA